MPDRTIPTLYRPGDIVQLRDATPPTLALVLAVRGGRVRIGYVGPDGQPVRCWVAPAALVQATAQYAISGIPAELEALREG